MFAQKNRLLFVLIVIIILPALLTSAAGAENIQANENDEEITIAYVPRSLDNPIFLDAFEHAQEKALTWELILSGLLLLSTMRKHR